MTQTRAQALLPAVVLLLARVFVMGSEISLESIGTNRSPTSDVKYQLVIEIPLSDPSVLDDDLPGEALSPRDFNTAAEMVHVNVDTSKMPDPIELAGLFEGDIAFRNLKDLEDVVKGPKNKKKKPNRNVVLDPSLSWPNGVIPYVISSSYDASERATIAMAMRTIETHACIRFVPRSSQTDYIHVLRADGCSSSVGRIGGAQAVTLGPGCMYAGIVMHEFLHAAGFWHEQSRPDRDDFITINYVNILEGMEYNFQKYTWNTVQSLGLEYDLNSIMHYGPYAFAKDRNKPTIVPKKSGGEIGQRRYLSRSDILKLQKLYNCSSTSAITQVSTEAPITLPPAGGNCRDHNKYCDEWAATGECEKNPTWMHVSCRKSCKQCGKKCSDNSEHCDFWMSTGECTKNAAYMSIYCKRSCGLCHSQSEYQGDICEDKNPRCKRWADNFLCKSNPNYMLIWCRKSCGVCSK